MIVLFDGVAYGMLLFLISLGLSVTLGLMNFVNLAHGVFAMVGGYISIVLVNTYGINFFIALILAFVSAALVGVVLHSLLYKHLYKTNALNQVLFSIGLVFVSVSIATFMFGPTVLSVNTPEIISGQTKLFAMQMGSYRLFLLVFGLILFLLVALVFAKTKYGHQIKAAVDNAQVAQAVGLNVDKLFLLTFALGSGLAGLGGALSVDLLGMAPNFPLKYIVYFLLVVSMGGAGTILGTFYAAMLVGLVDTAGKYYLPQMGGFLVYFLMIFVLIIKPQGLLTKSNRNSAS